MSLATRFGTRVQGLWSRGPEEIWDRGRQRVLSGRVSNGLWPRDGKGRFRRGEGLGPHRLWVWGSRVRETEDAGSRWAAGQGVGEWV